MSNTPRYLWQLIEPLHAVIYFAPETKQAAADLGLSGKGMGYVAFRAAPLGRVSAATVTAAFFGFHPTLIRGAVPAVWKCGEPEQLLTARADVVDRVLTRLMPDLIDSAATERAAELLAEAAAAADVAGRPMAAGNRDVPSPAAPHVALWQAATTLREHRGDGHVAALVTAQVDPCAAHVIRAATGAWSAELFRATRGWSNAEWSAAERRLQERGWLAEDGTLTEVGRKEQQAYERLTDELAAGPFHALGPERVDELAALLLALTAAVVDAGGVAIGGGLGSPWPPSEVR